MAMLIYFSNFRYCFSLERSLSCRHMTVGIYGLGRFGSFWAGILAKKFTVYGYNRTLKKDLPSGVTPVTEEDILSCDTIIFCTAISSFEEILTRVGREIKPGSLVMDTCSVKCYPLSVMERFLPETVSIIATHPMFGPDSAAAGVSGLPIVFWPHRAEKQEVSLWEEYFLSLELKVLKKDPKEHDQEAAYTQGITHFLGRVLKDLNLQPSTMATLGYGKLMEIIQQTCNDPYQLFLDLQRYNPYTARMRKDLAASFEKILEAITYQSP